MPEEMVDIEPTVTEQIFAVICVVSGSYIIYTSIRSAFRDHKIIKADEKFDKTLLATDPQK